MATRDRTQAWHLARGRMPTVLVDFAGVRLEDAQGPVRIGVGRVLAKYDVTTGRVPVSKLLSSAERGRQADQPWLTTLVEHAHREPVLPAKGGIATVELPRAGVGDVGLEPLVEAVRDAAAL